MQRSRVICVGHAALDRVFTVEAWPSVSAKVPASRYEEAGGGMAANAAVAVARLGGDAILWAPLGDDGVADIIRAQLYAEGVEVDALRRFPGRTSSTSAVIVDRRGERLVIGYRGTALQAPADWLPLDVVGSAGALLADVRWQHGAAAALQAARDRRVPAILDAEEAHGEILETLVVCADHVVFSERGLAAFAPGDPVGGLRRALERGTQVAAVTQGAAGVMWVEAGAPAEVRREPGFAVNTVDTLAAGDVFHGAYALAIAGAATVRDAMRFGCAAAAIKCTRPGGRSGAPSRAEVEALLQLPQRR
jgi:sulfofructose kinase